MTKREGVSLKLGLIFAASALGSILYLVLAAGINYLFMIQIIPIGLMGIISKIELFVIVMISCKIIKGKIREEKFINCILGAIILNLLISLISSALRGWEIDPAGFVICLLISIIGCFLLFVKNDKYSKMHKKRKKH